MLGTLALIKVIVILVFHVGEPASGEYALGWFYVLPDPGPQTERDILYSESFRHLSSYSAVPPLPHHHGPRTLRT